MNAVEKRLVREYVKLAKEKGFVEYYPHSTQKVPLEISAGNRITDVILRLRSKNVDLSDMEWDFCDPGTAETHYRGKVYAHDIPPDIMLVGDAKANGLVVRFMKKFVSHPFHQHGRALLAKA